MPQSSNFSGNNLCHAQFLAQFLALRARLLRTFFLGAVDIICEKRPLTPNRNDPGQESRDL